MKIRRVGVLSLARIMAILYAGIGFIGGAIFACFALLGVGMATAARHDASLPSFVPALFGVGAVILFPIMYGIMGFVGGVLTGWLYNLCAGFVGGVELEMET